METTKRKCFECGRIAWHTRWSPSSSLLSRLYNYRYFSLGLSHLLAITLKKYAQNLKWKCKLCGGSEGEKRAAVSDNSIHKQKTTFDEIDIDYDSIVNLSLADLDFTSFDEDEPLETKDDFFDSNEDAIRREKIFRTKPKGRYSLREYWQWHDQLYLGGSWRSKEWKAQVRRVRERDGNRCVICGAESDLQTDHIVPLSKRGSNKLCNLQTLCKSCHEEKTGRPLDSFSKD